jgi:hypothetical protein
MNKIKMVFFKQNATSATVIKPLPPKRFSLLRDIISSAPKSCGCGGK